LIVAEAPAPLYIVGGMVRDLLLERDSLDLDFVLEGDAIAFTRALAKKFGGKVTAHTPFKTATWFLDHTFNVPALQRSSLPAFLDFITARAETYPQPASLPVVAPSTLQDDLQRRDFTISAIALRLDGPHFGELHDPLDGRADLQNGIIRVLHDRSFIDDPTRLYRAVRYEQRYRFQIEPRTLALIDSARPNIARLTPERIRHELDLILDEPRAAPMLARLHDLNLLGPISDVLRWDSDLIKHFDSALAHPPAPEWDAHHDLAGIPFQRALLYTLWLSPLPPSDIALLDKRLHFSAAQQKLIDAANALRSDLPSLAGTKPSAWTARLDSTPRLAAYAIWLETGIPELQNYVSAWRHIHPATNGDLLKARGLEPSPRYREILAALRNARLDGEVQNEKEESALLAQLLIKSGQ
jgi:tRNA nucleotidyltransferase (CCA-adding enzyme)